MSQKRLLALGHVLFLLSFLFIFTGLYLDFEEKGAFSDPIRDTSVIAGGEDKVIISTTDDENNENKVKVYFFHGDGCPHCANAANFFKSIESEYGALFEVISYETWTNESNAELLVEIGKVRNENVSGVPYILVGNKSWSGYSSEDNNKIIEEIVKLSEVDADDRYDIMKILESIPSVPEVEEPVEEDKPIDEERPVQPSEHVHSYTSTIVTPTCTTGGYTTFKCTCGHYYNDNVTAAYGHSYTSTVIAPTTETQGYTLHTCTRCGYSYKDTYTDKLPVEVPPVVEPEPSTPTPTIDETNDVLRRTIQDTYGIEVKYGSETDGYSAGLMKSVSITDPYVVQSGLNQLSSALALYPQNFFSEFGNTSLNLKVYLVQRYSTANVTGITDLSGNRVIISISMDYSFAESFHHETYHYIEHFIERKGGEFSVWNTYNPSDFSYGGTANSNLSFNKTWSPSAPFVNNYAQTNADEDRASTFEYMTASSKALCFGSADYPIWKKSSYMALMIDTYFDSVSPSVIDYWERFIY